MLVFHFPNITGLVLSDSLKKCLSILSQKVFVFLCNVLQKSFCQLRPKWLLEFLGCLLKRFKLLLWTLICPVLSFSCEKVFLDFKSHFTIKCLPHEGSFSPTSSFIRLAKLFLRFLFSIIKVIL